MTAGPRLIHIELRPLGDEATLATSPSGALFEIAAPLAAVQDLLKRCDGTTPADELVAGTDDPDSYGELLDHLREAGCLAEGPGGPAAEDEAHRHRFGGEAGGQADGQVGGQAGQVGGQAGGETGGVPLGETPLVVLGDRPLVDVAVAALEGFTSPTIVTGAELDGVLAALDGRAPVLMVLRDRLDVELLEKVNDLCAARGVRWAQFHVDQGKGWAGPAVQPGFTPDYRDLLDRRLTAADREDLHRALTAPAAFGVPYVPPRAELQWMITCFTVDLERWAGGAPSQMAWGELELDPVALTTVRHPLLPMPDRPVHDDGSVFGVEALIDARTGLITGLPSFPHHESIPRDLVTVQSNVADMRRKYTWANNVVCGGSKFGDPEVARLSAIGEAVERYCGNCVTDKVDVREASYNELLAAGEHAVDPDQLVLYTDRLYDSPGFPFVRFDRDLRTHWVLGSSVTAKRPVWVPASIVYVNWYMDQYAAVPPTNYLYYPGIAAGPNLDWALASGIEEIIERDATMIWWMNRHPLPAVEVTDELASLWAGRPLELGQRAWLVHLDNEFDFPVMAGVVENRREGLLNVGFAARPDPVEAARKAWTEALTLQDGSRDLDDPDGLTRTAMAEGWVSAPLQPWRADRRYLDSYAADFHDVNDLMCQQQVFLDPRAADVVRPWLDTPVTRTFDDLPRVAERSLSAYRDIVESRGYEIVYVELTTQDVAKAGMRVVRVLVPGLVPNFPAAFPFLGRRRIQDAAVRLGWRDTALTEEELNYFPLPHA
ncbi:ribosomal protein S12 methylthiotransferase accessory factor [Sinosporangium album]|uniref:Ribosomal protein S12 methylthiotransferase accessory factor n=1 Tax=Sinosporangium album TaxID=504805 RepID=A0A1G8HJJ9_9ACTN|nr:YcaO-like family protein [Sinosporangium album]SDI06856.1 ribosomal protein S12 methylthiotransferase accessory factor [Sinosporangium album]